MANPFLVSLFEHKAWCNAGLVEALRAAQARVDAMSWTVILLTFEHTSIVDRIFKARLEGAEPGFASVTGNTLPDLDALARTMAETDAWYVRYASNVSAPELEQLVEFTYISDGMAGLMSRRDILGHVITHGASHRGAIGKMLETLGMPGAPDMMTTFRRPLS
jgi:uncharacterized damage-inducible protein DinB